MVFICLFVSRIAMLMKTLHGVYLFICFYDRHADVNITWRSFVSRIAMLM